MATCIDWTNTPPARLAFRHADDPLRPGDARRASPWPAVGDVLVRQWHVPVLIISTGIGGTTVQRWREVAENPASGDSSTSPAGRRCSDRIPTGLRALIWFGNENDLNQGRRRRCSVTISGVVAGAARTRARIPDLRGLSFTPMIPGLRRRSGPVEIRRRKGGLIVAPRRFWKPCRSPMTDRRPDDLGPGTGAASRSLQRAGVREPGFASRARSRGRFPSPVPGAAGSPSRLLTQRGRAGVSNRWLSAEGAGTDYRPLHGRRAARSKSAASAAERPFSSIVVDGVEPPGRRDAVYHRIKKEDFRRSQVGVASRGTWSRLQQPHIDQLAVSVVGASMRPAARRWWCCDRHLGRHPDGHRGEFWCPLEVIADSASRRWSGARVQTGFVAVGGF